MTVDARVQKSTTAIVKAGLVLLNENKDATLTDVAKKAGVGRATLYRLFKNKEELVMAITKHCLAEYEQATLSIEQEAKSALHALELLFHCAMPLTLEFQFIDRLDYFIEISPELKALEQAHKVEMYELIAEIRAEVNIADNLSDVWLYNFIEGLFYAGWLQQTEDNCSAEQAAQLAYYSFSKAVLG